MAVQKKAAVDSVFDHGDDCRADAVADLPG